MKISVIYPVYNVENYIEKSLKSLLSQSYDDFEIIIINDNSKDASSELIEKINNPKLKIVNNKKNLGLSEARNIGLQYASGDLVYFMDSDDQIRPNFFEQVVKLFEENSNVDIISFNYDKVTEQTDNNKITRTELIDARVSNSKKALEKLMQGELATTAWSYIVKKSFVQYCNLHFSSKKLFEDMNTTSYLLSKAKKILIVKFNPAPYLYLQRPNSIMDKNKKKPTYKEMKDNLYMIKAEYKIFKENLNDTNAVDHWLLSLLVYYYDFYYCRIHKRKPLDSYQKEIHHILSYRSFSINWKERIKLVMVEMPFLFLVKNTFSSKKDSTL